MQNELTLGKISWIDLEQPSLQEIHDIGDQFDLPLPLREELIEPSLRSKAEVIGDCIFLVFHFPDRRGKGQKEFEIDFIITSRALITIRYKDHDVFHQCLKSFESQGMLGKTQAHHPLDIFFSIMRPMYQSLSEDLDSLHAQLRELENAIFADTRPTLAEDIFSLGRKLLDIRQALRFHQELLSSLRQATDYLFESDFSFKHEILMSDFLKIMNTLNGHREVLQELRTTHEGITARKTSRVITTLTLMTFTTLPISLTSGLLGMNTPIQFLNRPYAFWVVLTIAGSVGLFVFLFFKNKKWL